MPPVAETGLLPRRPGSGSPGPEGWQTKSSTGGRSVKVDMPAEELA